jgi:hypothetical protein
MKNDTFGVCLYRRFKIKNSLIFRHPPKTLVTSMFQESFLKMITS